MGAKERKEAAKEREEGKAAASKAKAERDAEDAKWADADNSKGKGALKKEAEEKKKQEAAAKKAEIKRLAEEEEASLSKGKGKVAAVTPSKVTQHQLDKQREAEEARRQQELRERQLAGKREVTEDSYGKLIETENTNRAGDVLEARTLAEAVSLLSTDDPAADKHPEKRARAAWLAYEARELPILKEEKPGLKMSQYRDMLWKMWQKSPENPILQARAAASTSG